MDKSLIISRIKEFKKFGSDKELSEFLGITPQSLSTWKSRNSIDYDLIFAKCEGVNLEWLLTGKGEMLNSADNKGNVQGIPLVSLKAIGGFGNSDFAISERDVKEHYVIPKFQHKQVDFMIEVEGSSMYPKYNSGDVVACRIIKDSQFIQWNKTHVIATKYQGILIKRIKESERENYYTMISDNKDYPPFEVPEDEIDGVALVVGVIRLE